MKEQVVGSWIGDRLHFVIDELARRELPKVRIGEPEYDENGKLVNRLVDGLSLIRALEGLTRDEANEAGQAGFLHELMCCLAARRGLVLVSRGVGTDGLTPEILARDLPPEDVAFIAWNEWNGWNRFGRRSFGSEQEVCLRLASEDELTPEDLVIYREISVEEDPSLNYLFFDRLVPLDELTLEQVKHAGPFVNCIEICEGEDYFLNETDRVNLAGDLFKGMEGL